MEYLVTMTTHVPDGTPEEAVDVRAREAAYYRWMTTELMSAHAAPERSATMSS
jgi:muconolactone delta-isomerase